MKNKSHKYRSGKRVNPLSISIALLIAFIWCISGNNYDDTYVREPKPVAVYMTATVVDHPQDESIETKIRKYFPRHGTTMIAIAHAESGMSMKAKGYNCYYSNGKATTTPIKGGSKACKVEDRGIAWSVDCFALQRNYIGKECPKGVTADEHLKEVADLSRVQGLDAWTVYRTGAYKRYLAQQ